MSFGRFCFASDAILFCDCCFMLVSSVWCFVLRFAIFGLLLLGLLPVTPGFCSFGVVDCVWFYVVVLRFRFLFKVF